MPALSYHVCYKLKYGQSSNQQGKSEGFDSCDLPGNLTKIALKSSIF